MKKYYKLLACTLLFLIGNISFVLAQSGKITGKVVDAETGEELIGATVLIQGTSKGTVTDIYGNYQLEADPGTYTLSVSYVGYANQLVEAVEVASEVVKLDFAMSSDVELEEVVVTAAAIRDNDVTLLKIQKNALAVQDGISSREMKQLGVSNAAESMKSVTGAAIEDGKFVVMRGLGDRYSITQLNGVTMPSADPYRNSTSMDLIPAEMIDNIVTVKTYTPDQPGNFTGGKVDITTKSLPDEFYFNIGVSSTYNTQSSFIDNFITDGANGGSDFLGYDDGTRAMPGVWTEYQNMLRPESAANAVARQGRSPENQTQRNIIDQTAKSLENPFVATTKSVPINYGVELSVGNTVELFGRKLGFSLGVEFNKDYTFYDDGDFGIYNTTSQGQLQPDQKLSVTYGNESTQLGGLFSLSYQLSSNHEITLSNLYNHDNNIEARIASGFWSETARPFFEDRFVSFQERELNNTQLRGRHYFQNFGELKMEWTLGYVYATQDDPDLRIFGYVRNDNGTNSLNQSIVGILPSHFYRDLRDDQYDAKLDFTLPYAKGSENVIKFGFNYSGKEREFNESVFEQVQQFRTSLNPDYLPFSEVGQDGNTLDDFFSLDNAGVVSTPESAGSGQYGFGNYYSNETDPANSYTGEDKVIAGYLMTSYSINSRLKVVGGARIERTDLGATSKSTSGKSGRIEKTDVLPALNIIYSINDNSNLRAAVSQTLARPNMREISPFAAIGGISYPIFTGNDTLQRTLIQNYDLRYEIYPKPGELIAVSAYYKNFQDPIVLSLVPTGSVSEIKPINAPTALVVGGEVEIRKSLDFIAAALENFKLSANFSAIYSSVDKSPEELKSLDNANRPDIKRTRPFQGQSPYIVNVALLYNNYESGIESALSFNIWGRRLTYITSALTPDVYEQPRPSLNFNVSKQLGEHFRVKLTANNILNMEYLKEYDADGSYVYESFREGREFGVSLSYSY